MSASTLWRRNKPRLSAFPLPNWCAARSERRFLRPGGAPGCATRALWSPEIPDPANRLTKSSMAQRTECYVDTSALIAFLDKSDSYYPLFRRLFSEPPAVVTSALVVAEGHGWFLRRYDQHRAVQFLAFLDALPALSIRQFGAEELAVTAAIVKKFADQKLTLADGHGLAILRERRLP